MTPVSCSSIIVLVVTRCQPIKPFVLAVAGVAGSGKSTLGRALAIELAAPLLDLDSLTNPLLDALPPEALGGHWLSSPYSTQIRDGRYAALRAAAADAVATAGTVVLVAPFTSELAGGVAWEQLQAAVAPVPVQVIRIVGDPALFASRRAQRQEVRDAFRTDLPPAEPVIPTIEIDAELSTTSQVELVLGALRQSADRVRSSAD